MCNLYSITTNQAAIIALFRVINRYVGNLQPMPGVFPDYPAPVVRNAAGERELIMMRWGMPPPPRTGGYPVTNIRNTTSPHWRGWLKPENRCLVPANSFAEYAPEPNRSAPRHHEARCSIDGVANSVVPMARADALRRTTFELERWDQQTSRRTR
jgi:putative SOS response-associated peptidase YedK